MEMTVTPRRLWARVASPCRAAVAVGAVVALAGSASAGFVTTSRAGSYVVRAGDTLDGVSGRFNASVASLEVANHLADPNHIFVGQVLHIPGRDIVRLADADTDPALPSSPLPSSPLPSSPLPSSPLPSSPLPSIAAPSAGTRGYPIALLAHRSRLALVPSFQHWAAVSGVPVGLLEALDWMESGWQVDVVSSTGAIGIGQLEPGTVAFVSGVLLSLPRPLNPYDADSNIRMSAAYLAWTLQQTQGDAAAALGAYYQGIGSLMASGPLPSTRRYVQVISGLWSLFGAQ